MSGSMQTSPWIVIVWYDVSWPAIYRGGNRGSERLQDDSPGSSRGGVEPVGLWRPVSAGHLACPTVSVCDLCLTCPFAWSTLFYLLKFSSPFKSQHQRQQHDICPRCRAPVMAGFYLSFSGRTSQLPGWCYLPPLGSCSLSLPSPRADMVSAACRTLGSWGESSGPTVTQDWPPKCVVGFWHCRIS